MVGQVLESRGSALGGGCRSGLARHFQIEPGFLDSEDAEVAQRATVMVSTKAFSAGVRGWNSAMREEVELLEAVLGFAFEDDGLRQEPWRIPFWEEMALPSPVTGPLDLAPWARAESILRCELIRRQDGARVCVRVGAKRGRIWRGRG